MSTRTNLGSEGQSDGGFAKRLSPLIAKAGVVAVPALLVRYQAALGLTDQELVYVLHVLAHKWAEEWPWVPIGAVATATGRDERNIRSRKESLVRKGYLVCRPLVLPHGGRGADEHDLSGLFTELERLAVEEHTAVALDEAQAARSRDERLKLAVRRRGDVQSTPGGENAPTPLGENAPTRRAKSPAPLGAKSPPQSETGEQKPLIPSRAWEGDKSREETVTLQPGDSSQPALPRMGAVALTAPKRHGLAEDLLESFYRGLGTDLAALTPTLRRRELAIAVQLVAVGATPAEAETYAREASAMPGRIAAVDLRAFERERASWLARRRRSVATGPRLIDRTGQPPSWSSASVGERAAGERHDSTAGAIARAIVGGGA